jgi:hypothetical protein
MVKVDLKGIAKVRAKGRTYYYAWRGGPRLYGEPGSPEFMALKSPGPQTWRHTLACDWVTCCVFPGPTSAGRRLLLRQARADIADRHSSHCMTLSRMSCHESRSVRRQSSPIAEIGHGRAMVSVARSTRQRSKPALDSVISTFTIYVGRLRRGSMSPLCRSA